MKVCICEKPSVAKDVAKVLGATDRNDGYYEGNGYQVTWTFGHLCALKMPEEYNPIYKRWNYKTLPIIPNNFKIKVINDAGVQKQFNTIKALLQDADEVINCGDAGQEGELIQRWVMQLAGVKCPVKRLWISSLTEDAIRSGFNNLQDSSKYDNLFYAGMARAVGDWLLGINATRYYTIKNNKFGETLSIGRVQTPTLAMIVDRDAEVDAFESKNYYTLSTTYKNCKFINSKKYDDKKTCKAVADVIASNDFVINDVKTQQKKEAPPKLFDLTSLQVHCNNAYGYSAEETLAIIQSLYEKKLATYPRVDTTYLTNDVYKECPNILRSLHGYADYIGDLNLNKLEKRKYVFDDSKVTDHHAIIPTGLSSNNLSTKEINVFDDIVKRFICVFHRDFKYDEVNITGTAGNIEFKASGKTVVDNGFYEVLGSSPKEVFLPEFVSGECGPHKPAVESHTTTPPAHYTEATLLRAMETAGKFVDDKELKDILKENGIGRPSTRANIIETLVKRGYIYKDKKKLKSTELGRKLISKISNETLKSAKLTGEWEKKLQDINNGNYDPKLFINELKEMVRDIVTS